METCDKCTHLKEDVVYFLCFTDWIYKPICLECKNGRNHVIQPNDPPSIDENEEIKSNPMHNLPPKLEEKAMLALEQFACKETAIIKSKIPEGIPFILDFENRQAIVPLKQSFTDFPPKDEIINMKRIAQLRQHITAKQTGKPLESLASNSKRPVLRSTWQHMLNIAVNEIVTESIADSVILHCLFYSRKREVVEPFISAVIYARTLIYKNSGVNYTGYEYLHYSRVMGCTVNKRPLYEEVIYKRTRKRKRERNNDDMDVINEESFPQ